MASARTTYETIESIFIAYYQRPGDASGVRFWADDLVANGGDVNAIINQFATSAESLALYGPPPPANVSSTAAIQSFINSIYQGLFGHTADAAGLAFYTTGYINGTFTQGTIALNILDGATGTDLIAVNNKIAVAGTFTEIQDGRPFSDPNFGEGTLFNATYGGPSGPNDLANARAYLATVLSSPTTIPSDEAVETFIKTTIANAGDPILAPDFTITGSPAPVSEGGTVQFTISAKDPGAAGAVFAYTLSGTGLTAADVVGGSLSGSVTLDSTAKAVVSVTLESDSQVGETDTIKLSLTGVAAADQSAQVVTITDTSVSPTFTITAAPGSVTEGGTVVFTVTASTGSAQAGNVYDYTLGGTGLTADDVVGGSLAGSVTLDATGKGVISVTTASDADVELGETMAVTLVGVPAANQSSTVVTISDDTSGVSLTLTPAIDLLVGTPYDDVFTGNGTTLNPGDSIEGGLPTASDTFNYASGDPGTPVFQSGFKISGVEYFNLTSDTDLTMDMSGTSGVVEITDTNSRANMTLTNGPEITDFRIINTTVAHDVTIAYQDDTVEGGNDTQNLFAQMVLPGTNVTIGGIENLNLTIQEPVSFDKLDFDALQNFNIDGTGDLWIDCVTFPGSGTLLSENTGDLGIGYLGFGGAGQVTAQNGGDLYLEKVRFGSGNSTIDASDLGGMMDVTLGNAGDSGRNVAVTGSDQDDLLYVECGGFNVGDTFDGMGGTDEIYLDPSDFGVANNAITNTEIADLIKGTLGDFDLAQFDTALNLIEVNTDTAWTVNFLNLEADGSELIYVDNWAADLDGKTVSFDIDGLYSGGATVNFEIFNVDDCVAIDFADTDTSGNGYNDPVGTLNLTAWGDGTLKAHLDPMAFLGVLGLAGSADFVITSDAPTVYQVNGGTTTGDVTIEPGVLSNGGSTVVLGSGYDTVTGGNGDDNIDIGTGGGVVDGGTGNDTITGSGEGGVDFEGGDGNDVLTGGDDGDSLVGGNGADTLTGNGGADYLEGDGGADTLSGGTGEDYLWGGIGADQISLGDDGVEDTVYYELVQESQGAGFVDTVHEFISGEDFVDLLDAMINAGTGVLDYNDMRFNGNAAGFAAAQGSLSGTGGVEIVYDTLATQVYVDVNGDGVIDGTYDMVIDFGSPATMQATDFGIDATNTFTAVSAGFATDDPSTSFENTTTGGGNDYVVAEGDELVGSYARGNGGTDTFTVTTPIDGPFDFQDLMNGPVDDWGGDFSRLNLHGGDSGLITGPDQWVDLIVNIGNAGGFFRTGTSLAWYVDQVVNSGSGDDDIRLTNDNDVANTRDGRDFVWAEINNFGGVDPDRGGHYGVIDTGDGDDWIRIQGGFDGTVEAGDGDDELEILAGTTLGDDAILHGGDPTASDWITVDGDVYLQGAADLSGWEFISYAGSLNNTNVHLTIDQYNGLGSDPVHDDNFLGTENMTFYGAGTANLDEDLDDVGMGDDSTQTFILGNDDTNIVGDVGGPHTGNTTVVSDIEDLNGDYDGGGGTNTFVQNVDADFNDGHDPVFTNFYELVLNNGSDIEDMSQSQHNSFTKITGNDIVLPGPVLDTNYININTSFTSGTTQNTIELYTIDNFSAGTKNSYNVGGSNQTVNDNDTSGSTVVILSGLSGTTLNTAAGNDTVTILGGSSNITVDTNAGDDTVSATAGGTNISITTDGKDTVNLGGTHTGLYVSTGIDDDIVNALAGSNLAGTIDVGTGNDTLNLASGDYSKVSFSVLDALDTLNLTGTSYTFSDAQFDTLINGAVKVTGLGGDETITISDAASVVFSNDILAANGQFQTLVTGAGDDSITFKSEAANVVRYLDISAGGDDSLTVNNIGFQAADNDSELVVTGFDVANDVIRLQSNGASNGNFQEILLGDTNLTIGPNGVVEVNTAVGALIGAGGAQSVGDGGAVETLIAGAIQSTIILGVAPQPFFAVLYASDNAAYVYAVNVTTVDANLNSGDFEVELLGQLNDVAANSMTLDNFFA